MQVALGNLLVVLLVVEALLHLRGDVQHILELAKVLIETVDEEEGKRVDRGIHELDLRVQQKEGSGDTRHGVYDRGGEETEPDGPRPWELLEAHGILKAGDGLLRVVYNLLPDEDNEEQVLELYLERHGEV